MKVLSIDVVKKEFRGLTITNITHSGWGDHYLEYEGCESPIVLTTTQYDDLLHGHIVELHHGEIALTKLEE